MRKRLDVVYFDPLHWRIHNNYAVDVMGNIISLLQLDELIQTPNTRGYLRVWIESKRVLSHRFVMEVWFGKSKLEVDHKNFINNDNRLSNLEYVTKSENRRRRKFKKTWSQQYSDSDLNDVPF